MGKRKAYTISQKCDEAIALPGYGPCAVAGSDCKG